MNAGGVLPNNPSLVSIVEDDQFLRASLRRLMRASGYTVETFASAGEFLAFPRLDEFACLIADINMPGLSGTELAQRARSFRDQLPVILLSGRESDSHGYPFIRKPILRSDLQRVVAEEAGPAKGR